MGLRPGEWEGFQPVELLAMWDAQLWRRSRDLEGLAVVAAMIANRIPFNDNAADLGMYLEAVPLYRKREQ